MEPTSTPDNARQPRGLARFWPVDGMPAPAQRNSDDEADGPSDEADDEQTRIDEASSPAAGSSVPTSYPAAAKLAGGPAAAGQGESALIGDTHMVPLGSRRAFDGTANGFGQWNGNRGGAFPPGATPADLPAPRFGAATPGAPTSGAPSRFGPASPFAPKSPASPDRSSEEGVRGIPLGSGAPSRSDAPKSPSDETPRAASVPAAGRRRSAEDDEDEAGGAATSAGTPHDSATGTAGPDSSEYKAARGGDGTTPGAPTGGPATLSGRGPAGTLADGFRKPNGRSLAGTSADDLHPANGRSPAAAPSGDQGSAGPLPVSATEAPMRPGDVPLSQIAFWDAEAITHFRSEWHEIKADFVDDPVHALTRAHDLLTDAVNELTEALLAERDELDPLRTTSTPDTESMRMAMRGYREFLDRILAL